MTTPIYSFIRFDSNRFILPILQNDTLAFQVRTDAAYLVDDFTVSFKTVDLATTVSIANIVKVKEGVLMNISFNITGALVYDQRYIIEIDYDDGNGGESVPYTSNHFVYDNVVSTVLSYTHTSDHLDFGYDTTITALTNKVRLPIRLYNQTPASITSKYTKSDGQTLTFGNVISDYFELETEYMNADFHRCVQAAFLHRTINATIDGTVRSLQLAEDYAVNYPNKNYGLATGSTKISSF